MPVFLLALLESTVPCQLMFHEYARALHDLLLHVDACVGVRLVFVGPARRVNDSAWAGGIQGYGLDAPVYDKLGIPR